MLDIRFVRANPDAVKENIKKKFQDQKLVLVDEVLEFDQQFRDAKTKADGLRGERNALSKQIGGLMAQGKKDEAEEVKAKAAQFEKNHRSSWSSIKNDIRNSIKNYLYERTKRRPMVMPIIIEI